MAALVVESFSAHTYAPRFIMKLFSPLACLLGLLLLAEGLKAKETGKKTSAAEMSTTGVWGIGDLQTASAERGREESAAFVEAAVQFIETWKRLRPLQK